MRHKSNVGEGKMRKCSGSFNGRDMAANIDMMLNMGHGSPCLRDSARLVATARGDTQVDSGDELPAFSNADLTKLYFCESSRSKAYNQTAGK
ncbi:hypothetical protein KIN20_000304 [Parelaphostrongylus tenuis]|uniref:Uncharacterized protein n=1 Tax=Parelaphostrongylus tenuis TaxID=148309 RepID=A0AAD5LUJ9_PARTN|nr:hypothetical protein KIN20_000304 [Parelaphostrongylus tenuis]